LPASWQIIEAVFRVALSPGAPEVNGLRVTLDTFTEAGIELPGTRSSAGQGTVRCAVSLA
jgi:hypothetical protein